MEESCRGLLEAAREQMARRVVGQKEVVDGIFIAALTGGHILLEGVPGLAKTLAVKTFAQISGLDYSRIQFTPDLLPADVSGTLVYNQATGAFAARKGPVFANVVLADEINRAPAKVQSALLEAMAERQVTIGSSSIPLPEPFMVLATQNPIEQEGTYSLPEAELDRFMLKILISYPSPREEIQIVRSLGNCAQIQVEKVLSAEILARCREEADSVRCDDKILEYIVSLVVVTRPSAGERRGANSSIERYISYGASPRAGIALARCAKAAAFMAGRDYVLPEDVKAVAKPVLRHRIVLSYEAAADGVSADSLIERITDLVPVP